MYRTKEWLRREYLDKNKSAVDIGRECGVTPVTIRYWARKFGLKRRRYGSKQIDDAYFSNIKTEHQAYWLGFIAADGSVQNKPKKRLLSVCLSVKDEGHLMRFRDDIKSTHSLYYSHRTTPFGKCRSVQLDLPSARLVQDLVELGVVPRKTSSLKPPSLDPAFIRHWIRGYFDGDGCVRTVYPNGNKPQLAVSILGTQPILFFIRKHCPMFRPPRCLNGIHRIEFKGNQKARKLCDYLYNEADICLTRKRTIFETVLQEN